MLINTKETQSQSRLITEVTTVQSSEAGLWAVDMKQALLLTSFIISKETVPLHFFSQPRNKKQAHGLSQHLASDDAKPLYPQQDVSDLLRVPNTAEAFNLTPLTCVFYCWKCPVYCLWLAPSNSNAIAVLKEPSERLTYRWNNDEPTRRKIKVSVRFTPLPWTVPNLQMQKQLRKNGWHLKHISFKFPLRKAVMHVIFFLHAIRQNKSKAIILICLRLKHAGSPGTFLPLITA